MSERPSRPSAQPLAPNGHLQGVSSTPSSAPGSFYGGIIGGSFVKEVEKAYVNEAGLPSTGREDALIGVAAAKAFVKDPKATVPSRHIFNEFSLQDRVALVSGGNGGIGLEMALALIEAGSTVYCIDLADVPSEDFQASVVYAKALGGKLKYIKANVTDQPLMNKIANEIAVEEGRLDVCIAAAGILKGADCLNYPIEEFQQVINVNVNGVFVTATACAREMARLGRPGSIILIASMSGSIANREEPWTAYDASKAAVIQMARSLACELGPKGIRCNSLSPGHVKTALTNQFLEKQPEYEQKWSNLNPLGRLGKIHEMRGPALFLASDASSYCTGSDIIIAGGQTAW
ncbi:NAD(P)-binding protein [Meredithblackwellia eburnea MCA 4105]